MDADDRSFSEFINPRNVTIAEGIDMIAICATMVHQFVTSGRTLPASREALEPIYGYDAFVADLREVMAQNDNRAQDDAPVTLHLTHGFLEFMRCLRWCAEVLEAVDMIDQIQAGVSWQRTLH